MIGKDDILAKLGLQTRKTGSDYLLPALAVFGVGALMGAGVALLLAPKSGPDLRRDLARTASSVGRRVAARKNGEPNLNNLTRDELDSRAQALGIDNYNEMSKAELIEAMQIS